MEIDQEKESSIFPIQFLPVSAEASLRKDRYDKDYWYCAREDLFFHDPDTRYEFAYGFHYT